MDDDKIDFFDGEDIEEDKPNVETPEQKEAREIADDTIERGHNRMRIILFSIIGAAVLLFAIWMWVRYFHPYVSEAQRTGRVMEVKCEGLVFKTYEGQMISEEYVADTTRVYQRDFDFSIQSDSLARNIMKLQGSGKRVTLIFKEYQGVLPWRGASRRVVTDYSVQ